MLGPQKWLTVPSQRAFLLACKKEEAGHANFLYVLGYSATRNCDKFAFASMNAPIARLGQA